MNIWEKVRDLFRDKAREPSNEPGEFTDVPAPFFKRETAPSCPVCCAKKGEPHTPECTESGIA